MSKTTGIIERAHQNDAGYWSILVEDQWYGTYRDDYTSLVGQFVEFEVTPKGNFKNASKVKPATAPAGGAPAAKPAVSQAQADRQSSIVLQSSYKTSAELLGSLITADKVSLGAKKDAFDNAVGIMDELAVHIYKNCIDPAAFLEPVDPSAPPESDWSPTEA